MSPAIRNRRGKSEGSRRSQFKKGQSGNPAGRTKRDPGLVQRCRDLTPKILDAYELIIADPDHQHFVTVSKLALAYGHGNPQTEVKHTGAVPVAIVSDDDA